MIAYLSFFMFPLFLFIIGAYLIFRGSSGAASRLSGRARSTMPFSAVSGGRRAAYSRLVIEAYDGRSSSWKKVYSHAEGPDMLVAGKRISLEHADVRIRPAVIHEGYISRGKGALEEFVGRVGAPLKLIRDALDPGMRVKPLERSVIESLPLRKEAKEAIARNIRKPLCISETVIWEGAEIRVLSHHPDFRGTLERPLLITDGPEEDALATAAEKAKTSVLLGAGLVVFSFGISLILLVSLEPF